MTMTTTMTKIPSPYKLLDYYGYEDAGIFFGREVETRQMVGEILSSRLLVLYSPSGSGKTSLIQAGVRPQLEEMGYRTVYTRMEAEPIPSVTRAVSKALKLPTGPSEGALGMYEFLKQAVQASGKPLVIFLDQFEEFFIVYRTRPELRREFIEQVARVKYDDELPVFLVLSLREDYLAHLHEFRSAIPSIFQNNANIRLEAFDEKAGRRAIEKPLAKSGWTLAPALADALVKDLNKEDTGIEPIKLQMVCGALWEQRPAEPGEIPLAAYEDLGGAETIIQRFIAGRLEQVHRRHHKLMVRVCEALKTPDNTKRYRSVEDLRTQLNIKKSLRLDAVLKPLVNLQVLREEERGGTRWYEFKHDYVAAELNRWIHVQKEKTRRKQLKRLRVAVFPGLILFLTLFIYLFIMYNTFYAGFSNPPFSTQEEEIIISRGFSIFSQPISTGLFISDVKGHEEKNKLREKFKISFWDHDNWLALADKLNLASSGKLLYCMGQKDFGIQKLVEALTEDYDIRNQAAEILGRLGKSDQNVMDVLLDALKYGDERIRKEAAISLGSLGKANQKVIDALLKALKDKNSSVRLGSGAAMIRLGKVDHKIIESFFQALKDKDSDIRWKAGRLMGIILLQIKSEEELIDMLEDTRSEYRTAAAYALAEKKPLTPNTLQKINDMKDSSPHPWVRLGAWKAFELLQDKEEEKEKNDERE